MGSGLSGSAYDDFLPTKERGDLVEWLRQRNHTLASALDRAIVTLDYVGGCELIVEDLRRSFYDEERPE